MQKAIIPECDFDDYFDEHTKWKGYDYYQRGLVKDVKHDNHLYSAKVNNYDVSFKYEYGDVIDMHCSCPLFNKGVRCKHLYAFIFQIFGQEREEERYTIEEALYTSPVEDSFDEEDMSNTSSQEPEEKKKTLLERGQGFVKFLNGFNAFFNNDEEKEKRNQELEDEMDHYGLDEDEKELVRSGKWEPWEFETDKDDLEEEDYYYEDDL